MTELNESEMDSVNGGYWINWPPRPSNKSSNEPDPVPLSTKPIIEPSNEPIDGRIDFFVQVDKRPKHYR